jgi:hypothetical protein
MTREEILARTTIKTEAVDVPEWGGAFTVRSLNAVDRVRLFDRDLAAESQESSPARVGVLLLIACLYDAEGNRVFRPEDAPALELHDGGLINRLCAAANRVNGLDAATAEAAEKK